MGVYNKFNAALEALQAGKELAKAETWANRANLVALLTVLITSCIGLAREFGYDLHVTGVDIAQVALGFATVGQIVSSLIHTAANEKAQLVPKKRK
jgi:hypothetical protein